MPRHGGRIRGSGGGGETITETIIIEVPVGDGDRDISYPDSFALFDQLSGTIGPIFAPDSFDLSDTFVADDLTLQESIDFDDEFNTISGLVLNDSIDFTDQLSGTIGPIAAPDTFDLTDDPVLGPLVFQESIDFSTLHTLDDLTATAPDSIDFSDAMREIIQFVGEEIDLADAFADVDLTAQESIDISDQFHELDQLQVGDSIDLSDVRTAGQITTATPDSLDFDDAFADIQQLQLMNTMLGFSDVIGTAEVDLTNWPDAQVSNSGWANVANMLDTNTGTAATLSASSSGALGTGGTENDTDGDLIASFPDMSFDILEINEVILEWSITVTTTGIQLGAGSCAIDYQYSTDNGGSWTTFFAQTAQNGSTSTLDISGVIGNDLAKLNNFRVRGVGTTSSGTGLLSVSTTANWFYARLQINLVAGDLDFNILSIADEVVFEDDGTVTITITRSNPSGSTSVNYATSDRTTAIAGDNAIVGEDYTSTSGTASFTGSETTKTFNVTLIDNSYPEPDRDLKVNLSGAVGGSISDGQATVTLQDDEAGLTFLQDYSGNGHHLTAGSTVLASVDSPQLKFGKGRKATATAGQTLTLSDDAFNALGDLAFTIVGNRLSGPPLANSHVWFGFSDDNGASNSLWALYNTNSNSRMVFAYNDTAINAANNTATDGFQTFTGRLVGGNLVIKKDGTEIINTTVTTSPTSQAGGVFSVFGGPTGATNQIPNLDGYELRVWKDGDVPSQATLDAIVASSGKSAPEGNELAFYRLQDT